MSKVQKYFQTLQQTPNSAISCIVSMEFILRPDNFQNLTWPNLQASTDNLSSFSQLNYFNVVLTYKKKQLE